MVVATGLSKDWVELAVRALLNDYPAHLETNEQQDLIYIFDFTPRAGNMTLRKWFGLFFSALRKGFMVFFKGWTLLMYCTYVLLNLLVLFVFFIFINILAAILDKETIHMPSWLIRSIDNVIMALSGIFSFPRGKNASRGYLHLMFTYIFGETRRPVNDLEIEKRLLRFIGLNQGKIIVAEIVKLTGWSVRKAQEEAAQLLANYHGDAEVTEEGVIVYVFPDLEEDPRVAKFLQQPDYQASVDKKVAEKIEKYRARNNETQPNEGVPAATNDQEKINEVRPIWQNLLPTRFMNDNDPEINKMIVVGNSFNWAMSLVTPFLLMFMISYVTQLIDEDDPFEFGSGFFYIFAIIPFVYSFLFWFIPLLRRPGVILANRRIDAINEEYRLLGVIFNKIGEPLYRKYELQQLKTAIISQGKSLRNRDLGKLFDEKMIELEAESHSDEHGQYYTLDELKLGLDVGEKIRQPKAQL